MDGQDRLKGGRQRWDLGEERLSWEKYGDSPLSLDRWQDRE